MVIFCVAPESMRSCFEWNLQLDEWGCLNLLDVLCGETFNISVNVFLLLSSSVFFRDPRFPCGHLGIGCELGHNPAPVHRLHYLLFARVHEQGEKEKDGEVGVRQMRVEKELKMFSPYC